MKTAAKIFLIINIVTMVLSVAFGAFFGVAMVAAAVSAEGTEIDGGYYDDGYSDEIGGDYWSTPETKGDDDYDDYYDDYYDDDYYYDGEYYYGDVDFSSFSALGIVVLFIIVLVVFVSFVLNLTFTIIALVQMKTRKPSTAISVCVLIFAGVFGSGLGSLFGLLAGIFLLCSKPEEYGEVPPAAPAGSDNYSNPSDDTFNYTIDN